MPPTDLSIERPALYVVATPIGNLGDISPRAVAVLGAVDRVLSEDTRHSRRLFEHLAIATPLVAYHDHNERHIAERTVARMIADHHAYALISDAGTPLISDPGFQLVARAAEAGLPVLSVPGPCALTAALSISGLATDRFVFEGFLPAQRTARDKRLNALASEVRTLIFYEAPHRIGDSIAAMCDAFGAAREAVVARELTKRFESVYRGTLAELRDRIERDRDARRGEFVVLVAGASAAQSDEVAIERMLDILLAEADAKAAVRIAVALSGRPRNEIYRRVLARSMNGVEKKR